MHLHSKNLTVAAILGLIASPASSAIMDIYATASVTDIYRSGIFSGADLNAYTYITPELETQIPTLFSDAGIGDSVTIHWQLDTESGDDDPTNTEDKSQYGLRGYPNGPSAATLTIKETSWAVDGNEGSSVNYLDQTDAFSLSYESFDLESGIGLVPYSSARHLTTIDIRPEEYVTGKALTNEFNMSGDNLGTGRLHLSSELITARKENDREVYEELYSTLLIDYQITSVTATFRNTDLAAVPLPSSTFLILSGLLSIGLLRRRKA